MIDSEIDPEWFILKGDTRLPDSIQRIMAQWVTEDHVPAFKFNILKIRLICSETHWRVFFELKFIEEENIFAESFNNNKKKLDNILFYDNLLSKYFNGIIYIYSK